MFRSSSFWKLYGAGVVLIVVTSLLSGYLVSRQIRTSTLAHSQHELDRDVAFLERLVSRYEVADDQLHQQIISYGKALKHRFTLIGPDGLVYADSEQEASRMENHLQRPEVQEALATGVGRSKRYSHTLDQWMLYAAATVVNNQGRVMAIVRSSVAVMAIQERINRIYGLIILAGGIATVFALILGFIWVRRMTMPLQHMVQVADRLADGDLAQRVSEKYTGEFGILANGLNVMAQELQHRIEIIQSEQTTLASILGSMVEGVVAIDKDERCIHVNKSAAEIFHYSGDNPVGVPIWEICRIHGINEAFEKSFKAGSAVHTEVVYVANTVERFLNVHADVIHNAQQDVVGVVAVLHDVTSIRRLEGVRRDFVANVSHELKTPLTAIIGMAETILDDEQIPGSMMRNFVDRIAKQAHRQGALVSDLLTLSRLESPELSMEQDPVDLAVVVRMSCQHVQELRAEKHIEMHVEMGSDPVRVRGDQEFLRQALDNLVTNAITYTPEQGIVWVRLQAQDDMAVIEVTDTGMGITQDDQERIFERFYRVDKARSRQLGGTGLGLAIVKHIALYHRGTVTVTSSPGEGSSFQLCIPLHQEAAA